VDVRGEPIQPSDNTAGQDRPGPVCAGHSLTGLPLYVRRRDTPRITLEAAVPFQAAPERRSTRPSNSERHLNPAGKVD